MSVGIVEPLAIQVLPDDAESALGFVFRVALENRCSLRLLSRSLGLANGQLATGGHAEQFANIARVPVSWMSWRLPVAARVDGQVQVHLFGQRWRPEGGLRRSRWQHCTQCLRQKTPMPLFWEISYFCVCPEHGTVLDDSCPHCGRSIDLLRPGWDVCSCGHYLTAGKSPSVLAEPGPLALAEWIRHSLQPDIHPPSTVALGVRRVLDGMTVDGAMRLVLALGGGYPALARARHVNPQPWVTSRSVHHVLGSGSKALEAVAERGRMPASMADVAMADLMNLAAHGLTAADRGRAAWLLRQLQGHPRPRRAYRTEPRQLDLFEEAEGTA